MVILPFTIKRTARNRRILYFFDVLDSNAAPVDSAKCTIYFMKLVWKRGNLIFRGADKTNFLLSYQSDAGDMQTQIKNTVLNAMNLGSQTITRPMVTEFNALVSQQYPAVNFALFPVLNQAFYDGLVPGYLNYANFYQGAFRSNTFSDDQEYNITPFPYLLFVLSTAFATYGYRLTGSFVTDPEIQRLVFWNNYAIDQMDGLQNIWNEVITWNHHVPEIKLGDLMVQLQKLFCLGFIFNSVDKTLEIVPLKEVIADNSYLDLAGKYDADLNLDPTKVKGFTLTQTLDSADELNNTLPIDWAKYQVGEGGESVATQFSTLFNFQGPDSIYTVRDWLVPQTQVKGSSPEFELNTNSFSPRLLFYRGMQPDSVGNNYPLGSWDTKKFDGTEITGEKYSLHWAGTKGLYNVWWKAYLDFKTQTRAVDRNIKFDVGDILALDFKKKFRIEHLSYVWTKITTSISLKSGLKVAKVKLLKTAL